MQPSFIDDISSTRQGHLQQQAKQQDFQSMLDELKKMQLAAMMGQSKPSVVLTDQTDLGDKMGDMADRIEKSLMTLDSSQLDQAEVHLLEEVKDSLDALQATLKDSSSSNDSQLKAIEKAISKLTISVPQPKVTIQAPAVDLKPLQVTMQELLKPDEEDSDKIDFDDYKAQDINNDNPDKQYVGFLSTDGKWYIIENDVTGNKMRYVFGSSNYAKAFKEAPSYKYKLLNEAVNATA